DTSNEKEHFFKSSSLSSMSMKLNCNVMITSLASLGDTQIVYFRILNPSILIISNNVTLNNETVEVELCSPFFAKVAANGKIYSVCVSDSISTTTTTLLKEVVSRFQFVSSPAQIKTKTWEVEEENSIGNYIAAYTLLNGEADSLVFNKKITNYTRHKMQSTGQQVYTNTIWNIATDSLYRIRSEDISESLIVINGKDTISAIGSRVGISFLKDSALSPVSMRKQYKKIPATEWQQLSESLAERKIIAQAYKGTLGEDNRMTLQKKLEYAAIMTKEEADTLTLKYRALAWLNDEDCKHIGKMLLSQTENTIEWELLAKALAITNTDEATRQVVLLLKQKNITPKIWKTFLPVLGTTSTPTKEAVTLLGSLAFNETNHDKEMKSAAQLALGGIAFQFQQKDSIEAEKITAYILNQMKNDPDTLQVILVLGNTGSAKALPFLKAISKSKNVSQNHKIQAIHSLRHIKGKETNQLLIELLKQKDKLISEKAGEIISYREDYAVNTYQK
ncbi:MAG: hypothetical protein KA160_08050, partial [Lacibacter sp.]|nr:hypothetical protein [Lacibacter sp.]